MQDRFKFRAWDKENNQMWYDNVHGDLTDDAMIYVSYSPADLDEDDVLISDVIPMQCTGLKDKNGKLIYEGDVLKDEDGNFDSLYWKEGCFIIDSYMPSYECLSRTEELEVIGNIYENPELLKDGEEAS